MNGKAPQPSTNRAWKGSPLGAAVIPPVISQPQGAKAAQQTQPKNAISRKAPSKCGSSNVDWKRLEGPKVWDWAHRDLLAKPSMTLEDFLNVWWARDLMPQVKCGECSGHAWYFLAMQLAIIVRDWTLANKPFDAFAVIVLLHNAVNVRLNAQRKQDPSIPERPTWTVDEARAFYSKV